MTNRLFVRGILIGLLSILELSLFNGPSSNAVAATGTNFNPGRIIDDQVFYDSGNMTVQQIQDFLVSEVPTCDTAGNQPYYGTYGGVTYHGNILRKNLDANYPPPYTCLRDYAENPTSHVNNYGTSVTAGEVGSAQIIATAAQTYGINPKVLLVLLEKESSIVTDDWPWSNQYRTATGYGCPDTGPNGTANCNSSFYGFYNQVSLAAHQFRLYANNPSSFNFLPAAQIIGPSNPDGHTNILYHPAPSNCGSLGVVIQNQATASLYDYTPYVPNQAALNNMYGTGDGCSSYGNRNFWRLFTDWFGNTTSAVQLPNSANSTYAKSSCPIGAYPSSYVERLHQPNSDDYLYTTSSSEACAAVRLGYIWDGLVFKNYSGANQTPVYRLAGDGRHVFTTDASIRSSYISSGFHDEGIAFYASNAAGTNLLPVLSLSSNAAALLTNSASEANYYQQSYGYINKGTTFYIEPAIASTGTASVSRLGRAGTYLYTIDPTERANAISLYGYGDEGTVFNASVGLQTGSLPVYRLHGSGNTYFFTTDRNERDAAVVKYGYLSEGIAFYVPVTGSSVYRLTNANGIRLYTSSATERDTATLKYGYKLEGVAFNAF